MLREAVDSHTEAAAAALKAGKSDLACKLYTDLLRSYDGNTSLLFNRSLAYSQQALHEKAINDLQKVLDMQPDCLKGHYCLGKAFLANGQLRQAEIAFMAASQLSPKNIMVKKALAELRRQTAGDTNNEECCAPAAEAIAKPRSLLQPGLLAAEKLLNLGPNASQKDIRKAYLQKVIAAHPDKGGTSEEFKELKDAYLDLQRRSPASEQPQPSIGLQYEIPLGLNEAQYTSLQCKAAAVAFSAALAALWAGPIEEADNLFTDAIRHLRWLQKQHCGYGELLRAPQDANRSMTHAETALHQLKGSTREELESLPKLSLSSLQKHCQVTFSRILPEAEKFLRQISICPKGMACPYLLLNAALIGRALAQMRQNHEASALADLNDILGTSL